jgi:nicotinamidase-related amidase
MTNDQNPENKPMLATRCFQTICFIVVTGLLGVGQPATAEEPIQRPESTLLKIPTRPRVPGTLKLQMRSRVETAKGSGKYKPVVRDVEWNVADTVIIICDMWDDHYCKMAAERVGVMAPKMNRVIGLARGHGVMIVHAPSGTKKRYAQTPFRLRLQQAKMFKPPVPIASWCYLDPKDEAPLPIDDRRSDTKAPCDDPIGRARIRMYSKQHDGIRIAGYDGISDNGVEIYNFCRQEGIKNVVVMGVHTNMCILGRPFGIRQMTRLGMNVVLARDLTDAMYDPRSYPYVSHTRGTELVIEHIEKYWCPTIVGEDLTKIISGSSDPLPETLSKGLPALEKSEK